MKASNEEELEAILIDAVKENDLQTIREREAEVRKCILSLILTAYQENSTDSMIKHLVLVGKVQVDYFKALVHTDRFRVFSIIEKIFKASIDHGNYDVFREDNRLYAFWTSSTYESLLAIQVSIGRKRNPELIAIICSQRFGKNLRYLIYEAIVPLKSDAQAELLALECFDRVKSNPEFRGHSGILLQILARKCCSVDIAKLLLENGTHPDGGSRYPPLYYAAKQTSQEAAMLIEFLVRRGAQTPITVRGLKLAEYPGLRNIQRWIGITWEELVNQSTMSN